ncbi:unnamed protein product [Paramecium sonneborni]|uniref:Uncharacterized protein n=1 Tax=Paramecium sonneborni TaxID=65129 RepID=A0A8S1M088_9CILI|nr:unnamed protein product [Paramecium sonneborni]
MRSLSCHLWNKIKIYKKQMKIKSQRDVKKKKMKEKHYQKEKEMEVDEDEDDEDEDYSRSIRRSSIKRNKQIPQEELDKQQENQQQKGKIRACRYESMRSKLVQTFQNVEATIEYCEKHYSTMYPANISKLDKVIQIAKEKTFQVYDQQPKFNLENINDVLSIDNNQDILNYIENKNIFNIKQFDPKLLYHKFNDQVFYNQVMQIYRKRKFYDYDIISLKQIKKQVYTLILEYFPLIIKRVHQLQQGEIIYQMYNLENNIVNTQFIFQKFSTVDKLVLIYYLWLQERVNEAVQIFSQIPEAEQQEQQLQFDYLSAYLDFYTGYPNFQKGRDICKKYLSYPVIHWRNLFYEMINLLIEYDGEEDNQFNKLGQIQQQQQEIIKKEETLPGSIEGDSIIITFSNLPEVKIQYYTLDIEILFSNNPFMKNIIQDFSIVLPNVCVTHKLEGQEIQKNLFQQKIKILNEIQKENLFVTIKRLKEVGNLQVLTKKFVCLNNDRLWLNKSIQLIRIIKIYNKFIKLYFSKVYVKVYQKNKNDQEPFHKDGYTDLRGRFDYASLSSSNINDISLSFLSRFIMKNQENYLISITSSNITIISKRNSINWKQMERIRITKQVWTGKGGKGGKGEKGVEIDRQKRYED